MLVASFKMWTFPTPVGFSSSLAVFAGFNWKHCFGSHIRSSWVWVYASWSRPCPITSVQGNILVSFLLWTKDYQELLYCSRFPCDSSLQISSLLSSYGTRRKQILISTLSDSEDLWRGFPKTFHGNFHYPFSCLLVLSRETFGNNKHG